MALLGTYVNAGAISLASGTNCLSHSITVGGTATAPDTVCWMPLGAQGAAAPMSIPVHLITRAATWVGLENRNGGTVQGDGAYIYFHSIVR